MALTCKPSSRVQLLSNRFYGRLEYTLHGIVIAASACVGVLTERLDYNLQRQLIAAEISNYNKDFAHQVEAEIAQLLASAKGLAATVALNPSIDERQFSAAAVRLGTDDSVVIRISLATDGIVRYVYPEGQRSPVLGRDLRSIAKHIEGVDLARRTGLPVLVGPMDLIHGGTGLILRLAFGQGLEDKGPESRRQMVSIVIDSARFFDKPADQEGRPDVITAISRRGDEAVIWGDPSSLTKEPIAQDLQTPTETWQVASAPSAGWPMLSSRAPSIAALSLLRSLIVCAVLRTIFGLLRKQKAAEQQLIDSIEALDDGFAVFDSTDRLKVSNSRYREIYRTSSDLLVPGTTFEDILRGGVARGQYPDAMGQEELWIERRLVAHRAAESSLEQKLDDGRWLRVVERRTNDGSVVGFRVDITELKAAIETAKAAEQAKSDFIAVLSHELRTPLTITTGYVSLLMEAGNLPIIQELKKSISTSVEPSVATDLNKSISVIEEMAAKAHRASRQLLELMNHLLDFSKLEAGKMELQKIDLAVPDILADIESAFREPIEAKGLMLKISGVAAIVRTDPIRLRQVLMNLVSNSLKFTDVGQIHVRAYVRDGFIVFEVHDTGSGIPDDVAGRLFSPFEQVDSSSTRRAKGTGLGLAISKSLVELMDGEIGFESKVQSGSLFWFAVPLAGS
jgi:two-component system, cell cycle sensor histidine kinase PleC